MYFYYYFYFWVRVPLKTQPAKRRAPSFFPMATGHLRRVFFVDQLASIETLVGVLACHFSQLVAGGRGPLVSAGFRVWWMQVWTRPRSCGTGEGFCLA